MNKLMCAKLVVVTVLATMGAESKVAETITFRAVCPKEGYPEDGTDENNSFAKFTPTADLTMTINNPNLFGKYKEGDEVYVHFSTPGNVRLEPEQEDSATAAPPIPLPDVAQPDPTASALSIAEVPTNTARNFGEALQALKQGKRVARAGWNGKGMFVYLVPAASYPVQTGAAKAHFGEGSMVPYNAYLALKGVDDTVSTWAPSGSDALAEDWEILDE